MSLFKHKKKSLTLDQAYRRLERFIIYGIVYVLFMLIVGPFFEKTIFGRAILILCLLVGSLVFVFYKHKQASERQKLKDKQVI